MKQKEQQLTLTLCQLLVPRPEVGVYSRETWHSNYLALFLVQKGKPPASC